MLRVVDPGPLLTVQDRGRQGWQRFGVTPAGALDPLLLVVVNLLVGNEPGAAALEFTLTGGRYRAEEVPVRVAVVGNFPLIIDGRPAPAWCSHRLEPGQELTIGQGGVRGYLAVEGGVLTEPVLGSRATHSRSGLGQVLRAGDPVPCAPAGEGGERVIDPARLPAVPATLRIVLGPQNDYFTPAGIATLLESEYRVGREADRMGYRLIGPRIEHAGDFNIVSDGIGIGAVQVPGNGQPIVLLADRQSTGGYPKIAGVISVDLRAFAHLKPGDPVRFREVSLAEAQEAARARARFMAGLPGLVESCRDGYQPTSERLLALNLIGGVVRG